MLSAKQVEEYNGIQVLEDLGTNNLYKRIVRARCHCGKEFTCCLASLKSGNTKSCGCQSKKHMIGDKTLSNVAGSKKEYARCLWLMKNKGMTPEEALEYHRPPAREDKDWIRKINQRKRYGIKKEFLNLPSKYLIEMGFDKQSKYFYQGVRLKKYCEKRGISYTMVYKRIRKFGLNVKDAMKLSKEELLKRLEERKSTNFVSEIEKLCKNNNINQVDFYKGV